MNRFLNYFPAAFAALLLYGCVKDKPVVASAPSQLVQLSSAKKVYVVNEGNFGTPNSSISLFDPGSNLAVEDIYQASGNGVLGDVAQSLSYINGRFFVVVNNSGRITVCDAQFKKTAQITGISSPRYIQQVSHQKAYVSDMSSNSIHIIDLNNLAKTGGIPCSGWTEKMAMLYNKVFVTNLKSSYLYVIDAVTDSKADSILVGRNAAGLVLDKQDKLWVLAGGDSAKGEAPKLHRIDPVTNKVDRLFSFKISDKPGYLCINAGKDSLYYLNGGVYRMLLNDNSLPATALINSSSRNYYGLGVSPGDYRIYAADALDYSQRSNVYYFNVNGVQLGSFKAGINSNGFYFE